MGRNRGGGSSARSGGLFAKPAAPAPAAASSTSTSRGGLFGSKAAPAPTPVQRAPVAAAPAKQAPPPPSQQHAPPPAQTMPAPAPAMSAPSSGGGMMSGLGGMVVQGMAMGTGSAIAHQAVNGVVGAFSGGSKEAPQPQAVPQQSATNAAPMGGQPSFENGACALDQQSLYKCLNEQGGNAAGCQYYFDALRACQENAKFGFSGH